MPGAFARASRFSPCIRRRVKFDHLELSVTVRSLQERNVGADALEPHDAVHPTWPSTVPSPSSSSPSWRKEVSRGR